MRFDLNRAILVTIGVFVISMLYFVNILIGLVDLGFNNISKTTNYFFLSGIVALLSLFLLFGLASIKLLRKVKK